MKLSIVAVLFFIVGCNDQNSDTDKRKHEFVDSLKKLMPAYTPEKMIEHYKKLNGLQKAATSKVEIDFQRLTTILSNIPERHQLGARCIR